MTRERARRSRCADGSDAANPRPSAAPDRIRRGTRDSETAHRELEGTPRENPAAPTALARGHRHGPFPARRTFDGVQDRAQGTAKFEFLSLAFGRVRQQRQLVQPLLKLRSRFRHRRAGGGPMTGLAPVGDGFFNEPSLGIMLREELGLAVHQLRVMGCRALRRSGHAVAVAARATGCCRRYPGPARA